MHLTFSPRSLPSECWASPLVLRVDSHFPLTLPSPASNIFENLQINSSEKGWRPDTGLSTLKNWARFSVKPPETKNIFNPPAKAKLKSWMALGQKLLFQDSKTETYKGGKENIIWMNHGHQQNKHVKLARGRKQTYQIEANSFHKYLPSAYCPVPGITTSC